MCSIIVCEIDNIRYFSDWMLMSLDKSACRRKLTTVCMEIFAPVLILAPFRPRSQQVNLRLGKFRCLILSFFKTQRMKITLGKK